MKLYKKEIKPYIQPPQLQGFNDKAFPVEGYDWVSEDLEDKLRDEIVVKDPWSKLFFRVRYVEFTDIAFNTGEKSLVQCIIDRYGAERRDFMTAKRIE